MPVVATSINTLTPPSALLQARASLPRRQQCTGGTGRGVAGNGDRKATRGKISTAVPADEEGGGRGEYSHARLFWDAAIGCRQTAALS